MNNGFENDNINANSQPGDENDNINSDMDEAETTAGADVPGNANSDSAQPANGSGKTKSENAASAEPDPDGEPDGTQKEKFSFKNFKISDIFSQLKNFWTDMPPKRKKIVIAAAIAVVVMVVVLAVVINVNRNPMVTIYTGLERAEATEMAGLLMEAGMTSKVDTSAGAVILTVKKNQEYTAVLELSRLGYPKKAGLLYTEAATGGLFDTEAQIAQRELTNQQNRLGAVIGAMEGIEQAHVTIVPADKTFAVIAKTATPTTANVVLYIIPGYTLTYESIMGIENLLLTSVAGLTKENVTVHDSTGAVLNIEITNETQFDTLAEFKKGYEREAAYDLEQKLLKAFESAYGEGNFTFSVSIEYDFNTWIRELVKYNGANVDPDTEEVKGILSNEEMERNIFSGTDSTVQGAAGTDLNMDDPNYYELSDAAAEGNFGDNYHRYNQYLVDSLKEQSSKETPNIVSCTIMMVLNTDELESDEEENLIVGIATASPVGGLALKNATEDMPVDIDTYRNYVSIVPLSFQQDDPPLPAEPTFNLFEWLIENFTATQLMIGGGILLLFILLIIIIIVIVRRLSKKDALEAATAAAQTEEDGERGIMVDSEGKPVIMDDFGKAVGKYASAEESVVNPIKPNENKEQLLKKQIRMFTDQNPDITAELIRTLLKGDELSND